MNSITRRQVGEKNNGEAVYLFNLLNDRGTEVIISNYGAIVTAFNVKKDNGTANDIVLGFDRVEDYMQPAYLAQHPWFGCAVGRYANRIKSGRFTLDGINYQLPLNKNGEHLHGGREGFDRKYWTVKGFGESPRPFLELSYTSPDGEEGYPGKVETTIRYELGENNELRYRFRAVTDKATPLNLTQHTYFNLNNGEGTIGDQEIKIYASHTLEQDEGLVATGKLDPVEGTAFDLRDFHAVEEGLKKIPEYDKSYVIDRPGISEPVLVAEARNRHAGLLLQVFSTEPIVHFYSGKWIPEVTGKYGQAYGPFSGFCLETHRHPNAVNIPGFPDTILRPGKEYMQETFYRVLPL